jgi:mxaJ protein
MCSGSLKIGSPRSTRRTRRKAREFVSAISVCALCCLWLPRVVQGEATTQPVLTVSADPNNLPYSNEQMQGFENKLAQMLAEELHTKVDYVWWAQRRGYLRNTVRHGEATIVLGVPRELDALVTTTPYYRSCYCVVTRADRGLGDLKSLDDPRLRTLKVGVQLTGNNGVNTPPAHALASRGIVDNVVGYTVYGDYRDPSPPARVVEAVAKGEVDCALVWGPQAGYFAHQQSVAITVTPLAEERDGAFPLAFDISIGVKRSQKGLVPRINEILAARRGDIEKLLDEYHVPRLPPVEVKP